MSRSSGQEDMRDAVHALLRDMRSGAQISGTPSRDDAPLMFGHHPRSKLTAAEQADLASLRADMAKLEKELHATQEALRMERQQHANTKELLRLALRSSAPDVVLEGSPDRRRYSPSRVPPSEIPAFVKNATQMTLSPRHLQTSGAVLELFSRVTSGATPKRGRTPTRPQQGSVNASARSSSNGSSAVGSRQQQRQHIAGPGSRASSPSASSVPFGSRAQRFQSIALSGHHATFAGSSTNKDELTREEAKQLANEMRKAGLITPTRSPRTAPGESPVFTGTVKASPSAASRLRSPDIAAWVKQIAP